MGVLDLERGSGVWVVIFRGDEGFVRGWGVRRDFEFILGF